MASDSSGEFTPDAYPDRIWTCSCGAFVLGRDWRKHVAEKHPEIKVPEPALVN